jgi:hypothetical protein
VSGAITLAAPGDGKTDATAAIQAAENSGAGQIVWPAGTYLVNPAGLTKRAVTWVAAGPVTIKAAAGTWTVPLVSGSGLAGFGIIGMGFDTSEMAGATPDTAALALTNCNGWRVRSCSFTDIQVFGIAVDGGSDFAIQDCTFNKPNSAPTQNEAINVSTAAGPVVRAQIIDNTLVGSGMDISAQHSIIARNLVFGWAFGGGITTEQSPLCSDLLIAENRLIGGTGTDANSTVVSGIENWAPRATIIGNTCAANAGSGIDQGGMGSTVSANTCFNNGQVNGGPGICTRYGSATYNGSYSLYIGNNCFDTQTPHTQGYGYTDQSAAVTDVTLADNKFRDCLHGPMNALGGRADFRGPQLVGHTAYAAQSVNNGASAGGSFTVAGAEPGDSVLVAHTADLQGCKLWGWVSAPNAVSFRIENNVGVGINVGAGTVSVTVEKPLNYGAY